MSDEADVSRLQQIYNEKHAVEIDNNTEKKDRQKAINLLRGGSPATDNAPLPVQEHDLTVEDKPEDG